MSRNNLILVLRHKRRFYVIADVCADLPCGFHSTYDYYLSFIGDGSKYTYDMGKALVLAHKMQRRLCTEYGVSLQVSTELIS